MKSHTSKADEDSIGKPKGFETLLDGGRGRLKRGNESVGTSEKGKAEFQAAEKIFVS